MMAVLAVSCAFRIYSAVICLPTHRLCTVSIKEGRSEIFLSYCEAHAVTFRKQNRMKLPVFDEKKNPPQQGCFAPDVPF